MKERKMVRRSEMTVEDIGLRIIDDRPYLLRKACHGDPSRSFWIRGRPFPLCSRCFTLYPSIILGTVIGGMLILMLRPVSWVVFVSFCLLEAPLVLDGSSQYFRWRTSNNLLRALTGGLSGIGVGLSLIYIFFRLTARV